MNLAISRALLDQILAHARAYPGVEVCGLLLGDRDRISGIVAAANIAADPAHAFEVDPAVLIAAHRAARSGGAALLGNYHSHPGGMAHPSARDAAAAEPGSFWLIVAGNEARLFAADHHGPIEDRFTSVAMIIE